MALPSVFKPPLHLFQFSLRSRCTAMLAGLRTLFASHGRSNVGDLSLAVGRQVIGIFGHQHLRDDRSDALQLDEAGRELPRLLHGFRAMGRRHSGRHHNLADRPQLDPGEL